MRVKAVISYDGSAYHGFQRQSSTSQTVTSAIETALHALQIDSPITGSGRTDAGVHASGQVIHFDLPHFWQNLEKLRHTLNRKLTHIQFKHITYVDRDFHARFSARKRVYRYVFKTQKPSIFEQKYIAYYASFDTILLHSALKCFEGEHDFQYFHKTGSVTHTTTRKIFSTAYKNYHHYHILYFTANGFLRSQIRMMVDTILACAQGKMEIEKLEAQLQGTQRYRTTLAPAEGLYLARILYDNQSNRL